MLSDQQLKDIAGLLKIDAAAFSEAVKATEEKPVTIPTGLVVLDEAGLKRLKDDEYANGKTAGVEIAIKDYKEKSGVDFQGKTIEGLAGAIAKKAVDDAKIPANEKVTQLEADIATLRTTNTQLNKDLAERDTRISAATVERDIFQQIPSLGENATSVDKVLKLMRVDGYEFRQENGATVAYKDGKVVKDNLAQVIPLKDVITGYAKQEKLITDPPPVPGGRGGKDTPPGGKFSKLSELAAHYKAQGKSMNGQEFMDEAAKLKTDNPEFEYDPVN